MSGPLGLTQGIGEPIARRLPEGWELARLKHLLATPLTYGANEAADGDDRSLPRYIRITDIDERGHLKEDTYRSLPWSAARPYLLKDQDILLARSGSIGKSYVYRSDAGPACFAGYLIRARVDHRKLLPEFLAFYLNSRPFWEYVHESSIQATIQNVSAEKYGNLPVSLPPLEVQRRIAAFLDHETARIDELVHEQEHLLSLLEERRAATIRSAIRGTMERVSAQQSTESDWLGKLPSAWRKLPSRAVFTERNEKNRLGNEAQYLSLLAGIGIIRYEDKGNIGNKMPEDLSKCKVVRKGSFVLNSMNFGIGAFGLSSLDGVCSPVYVVLEPKLQVVEPRYAMRIFQDHEFQLHAQSFGNGILAHRSAIGWAELKNIPLPIPPLDEQRRIMERLDLELSEADQLVEETRAAIALLLERRSALISAAVTGQLDLRDWTPPAPEAVVEVA